MEEEGLVVSCESEFIVSDIGSNFERCEEAILIGDCQGVGFTLSEESIELLSNIGVRFGDITCPQDTGYSI